MRYIERHIEHLIKKLSGKKDALILTGTKTSAYAVETSYKFCFRPERASDEKNLCEITSVPS